jgi:alginate O-acetyltransferase complex protein AlgI
MEKKEDSKKIVLIISIIVNIGLLVVYKYTSFLLGIVNDIFNTSISDPKLRLPIGISFFTFQALGYVVDVYKREVKASHNYINFLAYISMFPQLIAGPIVRYETVEEELNNREITFSKFSSGFRRFLVGLFKKVLLANSIGLLFNNITNMPINEISVMSSWLAIVAYTLQIYFDFSGYSDMAIGMGKMMGFNFLENFNYPYISKSITEFWRRWHISLSSCFRDYIYIPLGGSRCSKLKNIRNIFIVWILTGLWHGASFNFLIWGLYYGIILLIEKFIINKWIEKWPNIIRHMYTIMIILIGWTIFAFTDIKYMLEYFKVMFSLNGNVFIDNVFLYYFSNYFILIIILIICSIPIKIKIDNKIIKCLSVLFYVILFIITISFIVSDTYNPFIYFRF